ERDFVTLTEANTHVMEKCSRAEIYVEGIRAVLHKQMSGFLLEAFGRQLQLVHDSFHFRLGFEVVLGLARRACLSFLSTHTGNREQDKTRNQDDCCADIAGRAKLVQRTHSSPFQGGHQKSVWVRKLGKNSPVHGLPTS